jgi:hypothetical protein
MCRRTIEKLRRHRAFPIPELPALTSAGAARGPPAGQPGALRANPPPAARAPRAAPRRMVLRASDTHWPRRVHRAETRRTSRHECPEGCCAAREAAGDAYNTAMLVVHARCTSEKAATRSAHRPEYHAVRGTTRPENNLGLRWHSDGPRAAPRYNLAREAVYQPLSRARHAPMAAAL